MNKHELYKSLLKTSLAGFVEKSFYTLEPTVDLKWNWHLDLICIYLEAVQKKEIKRLIINVPPRSLKSITVNVAFPAWCWLQDPTTKVISASFRSDLSISHNIRTRRIIASDWYTNYFGIQICSDQNTKSKLENLSGGVKECGTMKSPPTGSGANIIIIDDPHNTSEAESEVERKKVCDNFGGDFMTRLNNKQEDCIVVIMQRLHEMDLTGTLLERGGWTHLKIPAIADKDYTYYYPNSDKVFKVFKKGEILNPELESAEVLKELKSQLGSYAFNGQYMQDPFPAGEGIFKTKWFNHYEFVIPDKVYISLDSAYKPGQEHDPSCFTIWGEKDNNYYLMDVICERLEYHELKRKAISILEQYNPNAFLIEDKASGQSLIQDMKKETKGNIIPIKTTADKKTRALTCIDKIEAGRVYIPSKAVWVQDYLNELTRFPNASHDDRVDSTSQFINWIKTRPTINPQIRQL